MDDFVVVDSLDRRRLTELFIFELSIVGRAIWSEPATSEEKLEAFRVLTEALHRASNVQRSSDHPIPALADDLRRLASQSALLSPLLAYAWRRACEHARAA